MEWRDVTELRYNRLDAKRHGHIARHWNSRLVEEINESLVVGYKWIVHDATRLLCSICCQLERCGFKFLIKWLHFTNPFRAGRLEGDRVDKLIDTLLAEQLFYM